MQETPQGDTIPLPTRKRVFDDLRRVAKAPERPSDDASGGGSDQE